MSVGKQPPDSRGGDQWREGGEALHALHRKRINLHFIWHLRVESLSPLVMHAHFNYRQVGRNIHATLY